MICAPLEKRNWQDTRSYPSVYCNLFPAGLFARRPRFISMTRDTYLPDERLNWNKQIKSLTRRTEQCSRIKKANITSYATFVLIIIIYLTNNKFVHTKYIIIFKKQFNCKKQFNLFTLMPFWKNSSCKHIFCA